MPLNKEEQERFDNYHISGSFLFDTIDTDLGTIHYMSCRAAGEQDEELALKSANLAEAYSGQLDKTLSDERWTRLKLGKLSTLHAVSMQMHQMLQDNKND